MATVHTPFNTQPNEIFLDLCCRSRQCLLYTLPELRYIKIDNRSNTQSKIKENRNSHLFSHCLNELQIAHRNYIDEMRSNLRREKGKLCVGGSISM